MRHNRIPGTEIAISCVGVGCNNFGSQILARLSLDRTRAVVDAALAAGINFFDTAESYSTGESEQYLGEILRGRRDQVVIATKFGSNPKALWGGDDAPPGGSPAYVRWAVEGSLKRLGTDYIDLYYYHKPDGVTPLAETLGAVAELVSEGKVRAIGSSQFTPELLEEAASSSLPGGKRLQVLQNQYNLIERGAEDALLPLCREHEIGFVPYFPLASGLLTGKYVRNEPPPAGTRLEGREGALTDDAFDRIEHLESFARDKGHTLLEVAISGLASQPGILSVIAGATSPEQVTANAAAGEWELSSAELDELLSVAV